MHSRQLLDYLMLHKTYALIRKIVQDKAKRAREMKP